MRMKTIRIAFVALAAVFGTAFVLDAAAQLWPSVKPV